MHPAAAVLATALALVLLLVLPLTGRRRYQDLKAAAGDGARRDLLARRSMVTKWGLAGVAGLVALLAGSSAWVIWWRGELGWAVVVLIGGVALGAARIWRLGRSPRGRAKLVRAARRFAALLPASPSDRPRFVQLAITAGVTEEVLYRAFLIAYLHWLWPGAGALSVCALAGAAFGLVHLYQGWRSVILLGVLGFALGLVYLGLGLVVVIILHTLIDLRLLLIPTDVVAEIQSGHQPDDPAPDPAAS